MTRASFLRLHNQPWALAALVATIYCVVASAYIYLSSLVAAQVSTDVMDLQRIETIKGISFIVVTTLLLLLGLRFLFEHLRRRNALLDRQNRALVEAERRATAALFSSSLAHDLNNMVTISRSCIDELRARGAVTGEEERELLEEVAMANQRIQDSARRFSELGGVPSSAEPQLVELTGILEEALELARLHISVKHCSVIHRLPTRLRCLADPSSIHRAVINMMINAGDATGGTGRVLLSARREHDEIVIEVHDDGPGIPVELREQVKQPFYTTKQHGSGLGFLSLRNCAAFHDGRLEVDDSTEFGGACVRLVLPAMEGTENREEAGKHRFSEKGAAGTTALP